MASRLPLRLIDLAITDDIGVAAFAIREEAYAVDYQETLQLPNDPEQDLKTRDHERLLRSIGIFRPAKIGQPPAPMTQNVSARAIAAFASSAAPRTALRPNTSGFSSSADNLPNGAKVLPVARSLGLPRVDLSRWRPGNSAPGSSRDPVRQKMSALAGGFWRVEGPRSLAERHAVDMVCIIDESQRKDDLVLANDGPAVPHDTPISDCAV